MSTHSLRHRLANVRNDYQGDRKKVLCLCTAGMMRSPTAAMILAQPPFNYNTRAAGLDDSCALIRVDEVLLTWPDEFVLMEQEHKDVLLWKLKTLSGHRRLEKTLEEIPIHVFNIPDTFGFGDPQLVEIMTEKFLVRFGFKDPTPVVPFADKPMPHELVKYNREE